MPPIAGILIFLLVIASLLTITYVLSARYGRATDGRRLRDITREIALRDGSVGYPGSSGLPPGLGNDERSPRERLHGPPEA